MSEFIENVILVLITVIVSVVATIFIPKAISRLKTLLPGKGKIKRIIEGDINQEIKSIVGDAFGKSVLRYGIKIEWDEKVDSSSYLTEEGDVVIKLSYTHDKNQSRSFTKALMIYLNESFIPEAKPFVGSDAHDGCKYTIAKEITFKKDTESYRHYLSHYLSPLISLNTRLEDLMNKLELISQRGKFRSVLLREMCLLCESGILPRSEMRDEVRRFVDFLWDIVNKDEYIEEHGEEPPLSFINRYIKIAIVLVKRREADDYTPHIRAGEISFKNGAKSVYVEGWGNNMKITKHVAEGIALRGYNLTGEVIFTAEFEEEVKPGVCFVLEQ